MRGDDATTLFETVSETAVDVAFSPSASRARAASRCAPLGAVVVSQLIEYGAVVSSVPSGASSSRNWTPAMGDEPDAVAATSIVLETTAPADGAVRATSGGVATTFDTVTNVV